MYSNIHRLKASSPACDTFSRQINKDATKKTWNMCGGSKKNACGPKKIDCDMYSNRHRLKASSPALDTFTRKNKNGRSTKAGVCMRQNKHGSCVADHTCIQIDIAWTPLQVLLTHTRQNKNGRSEKSGVWMRSKKNSIGRGYFMYSTHQITTFDIRICK